MLVILDTQSNIHLMLKIANDLRGDLNTGIFFPSADTIAFTEGGSEAMRINSDSQIVHALGTASLPSITFTGDVNTGIFSPTADTIAFTEGGAERIRIDSDGNVLIGTTSLPADNASISAKILKNTTESCIIRSHRIETSSAPHYYFFNPNGLCGNISTSGSGTSYGTSSDYRLKENVNYNFDATTRLKQLKPARFNFISDANKILDGFLAHEVSDIVPEAITGTKDETKTKEKVVVNANGQVIAENIEQADWEAGKIPNEEGKSQYPADSTWEASKVVPVYQGIDQAKLTPILTKALQEAIARIEQLEATSTSQQTKIEQLEARLTALES